MHLFFDESGNTGVDLLNADQPIFALASTNLSSKECEELIGPLRQNGQLEAKYSKLKGTRKGQEALLRFAHSPTLREESCVLMQADKRYYVATQLVDKLIEPVMHNSGENLYAGDGHVALANLFFFAGAFAFPDGHWLRIQKSLVRALRQLTAETFDDFRNTVTAAIPHIPDDFDLFRPMLTFGAARIHESLSPFRGTHSFDPAVDIFIAVVNIWMERHAGDFHVTHDRSKPLRQNERFLRTLMTPVPARNIGYGQRKAELPLRISRLEFADSQSAPQLQVADVLAGMSVDCILAWSGARPSNDYHAAMSTSPIARWGVGGMMPDANMSRRNEPAPGEVSLVDGGIEFLKQVRLSRESDN